MVVSKEELGSYGVFEHYSRLSLPQQVLKAFLGTTDMSGFAIVGKAGVGKSAYAYNSIKTAYILRLCDSEGVSISDAESCWGFITREYGDVCFGKHCEEPDELDKKLRRYVFVGNEDIDRLSELIRERLSGESGRVLPVLFLDDLALKGLFHMGGVYRRLYVRLKRLYQYRRVFARTVIATAPSKDDLIDVFSDFDYIHGKADFTTVWFIKWVAKPRKVTLKFHMGDFVSTYKTFFDVAWKDEIPRKAAFGMPRWLEDLINERKRKILLDVFTDKGGDKHGKE